MQHVFFDVGKVERKPQTRKRHKQGQTTPPRQRQGCHEQVAGNAQSRYRNVLDFGEWAVIDDATVPLFIDGTRLRVGGVVNVESERGNHHTGQGDKGNKKSHDSSVSDPGTEVHDMMDA